MHITSRNIVHLLPITSRRNPAVKGPSMLPKAKRDTIHDASFVLTESSESFNSVMLVISLGRVGDVQANAQPEAKKTRSTETTNSFKLLLLYVYFYLFNSLKNNYL